MGKKKIKIKEVQLISTSSDVKSCMGRRRSHKARYRQSIRGYNAENWLLYINLAAADIADLIFIIKTPNFLMCIISSLFSGYCLVYILSIQFL